MKLKRINLSRIDLNRRIGIGMVEENQIIIIDFYWLWVGRLWFHFVFNKRKIKSKWEDADIASVNAGFNGYFIKVISIEWIRIDRANTFIRYIV